MWNKMFAVKLIDLQQKLKITVFLRIIAENKLQ